MLRRGHGLRSQKQHHGNAEVGRVPDVTALHPQHIFGRDGDRAAQRIRPEGRRANQNADADARDISAGGMHPFVKENPPEHQFEPNAGNDRQQRLLIALENAERQVTGQQNAGNESGRDVAVVEAEQRLLLAGAERGWR